MAQRRTFLQVRTFYKRYLGLCLLCHCRHSMTVIVKKVLDTRTRVWLHRPIRSPIYTRSMHSADIERINADLHKAGGCLALLRHFKIAVDPYKMELVDLSKFPWCCWGRRTGLDRGLLKIQLQRLGGSKLIARNRIQF